jgi:hypothetical protein
LQKYKTKRLFLTGSAIFGDKTGKLIYTYRSLLGVSVETVLIDNGKLKRIEKQISFVER